MNNTRPDHRLLSHRLRGFDTRESTVLGLSRALAAQVSHVEFDLRISRDQTLVAYHDPAIQTEHGDWQYVDDLDLSELRKCPVAASLATFDDMCGEFAAKASADTLLHVDVKIAGHETLIRDVLSAHRLLQRTVLVSWIPSVIQQFHALEPKVPLCFSHLTLTRARWSLKPLEALGRDATISNLARLVAHPFPDLARELHSVRLHVATDGQPNYVLTGKDRLRSNLGVVVPDMVTGEMQRILQASRGYVCIPLAMATPVLGEKYRDLGIKLAVFATASTKQTLTALHRQHPDIVYVDNAQVFAEIQTVR